MNSELESQKEEIQRCESSNGVEEGSSKLGKRDVPAPHCVALAHYFLPLNLGLLLLKEKEI